MLNCNQKNQMREKLLKKIQALCFTLYELNLYLDSHPTCKSALAYYKKVKCELSELQKQYEEAFGPITAGADIDASSDTWSWVENPWPWENEYNFWEVK